MIDTKLWNVRMIPTGGYDVFLTDHGERAARDKRHRREMLKEAELIVADFVRAGDACT